MIARTRKTTENDRLTSIEIELSHNGCRKITISRHGRAYYLRGTGGEVGIPEELLGEVAEVLRQLRAEDVR